MELQGELAASRLFSRLSNAHLEPHAFRTRLEISEGAAAQLLTLLIRCCFGCKASAGRYRFPPVIGAANTTLGFHAARKISDAFLCHSGVKSAERFGRASSRLPSALSGLNKFTTSDGRNGAKRPARHSVSPRGVWHFPVRKATGTLIGFKLRPGVAGPFSLLAGMRPGPGTLTPSFLSVCCHFIVDVEITTMTEGRKENKEFASEQP